MLALAQKLYGVSIQQSGRIHLIELEIIEVELNKKEYKAKIVLNSDQKRCKEMLRNESSNFTIYDCHTSTMAFNAFSIGFRVYRTLDECLSAAA